MSRIGSAPIQIPAGVTVEKEGDTLVVQGPKGKLGMKIHPQIDIKILDDRVEVTRKSEERAAKALHGLTRNLIANMILGVDKGWTKELELVGVGFRAQGGGNKLTLAVGYSHPVVVEAPVGVSFEITDNTKIKVLGIDKYLVGQVAANIKAVRPPDVYKGKGIRYAGEYIRKKAGKAGKVGTAVGGK